MPDLIKPILRVNGIPLRLAAAAVPNVTFDEIQLVTERSARGMMLGSRRGVVRAITCKTLPYIWPEAHCIAALVEGMGAACSFDTLQLNRAMVGTGTAGWGTTTADYFSQPSCLQSSASGGTVTWSNAAASAWFASQLGVTVNLWFKISTDAAFTFFTMSKSGAGDAGITCTRSAGSTITLSCPGVGVLTGTQVANSDWHMLTCVLRDTTQSSYKQMSLYVDGVLKASTPSTSSAFIYPQRDTFVLGPTPASGNTLRLDDLVVYPFPLTDTQVSGLFQSQSINAASGPAVTVPTPREVATARLLPQVWVSGDGVSDPMAMVGHVVGMQVQPSHRDPVTSALVTNAMVLDLQFMEAPVPA